ncbi:type III secretion apparatus protein, YscQ/HrcQ family [Chlamydia ibidis]|uniref:Type III secretion apparatus protein, YscQ/HrcQ family n=2 Tax=Chlamydia ibidis TaxID=1405396 RepID=S7KJR9_9CHLA|nr:type III secretion system cytoplasmic ring protein SctQ [Chlamydia ibidis]EPP34670.1 type III secretion apparatus protein, YscQ/HrcQ family [Chlamydia ibidis]EQM63241.1 type III secretion apparatus protein, YscQ/HrcQ family [Chlamydia ibidis 10-1398/6]
MTVTEKPNDSWLKLRNDFLSSLNTEEEQISLPTFPIDGCKRILKDKFRLEDCEIVIRFRGALSVSDITKELSKNILLQPLVAQPLESGEFFFLTSEEDLQSLMVAVFGDSSLASYFYQKDKLLGFHYYFTAELCKIFQDLSWIPSLTMKVSEDAKFSVRSLQGSYYTVGVSCRLDGKNIYFNLLFPETTQQSCKKFLASLNQDFDIHQVDPMLPIAMSVDVGYCELTEEEWQQVIPGSFILLDTCLYDPDTGESGALLTINNRQFFGGRFTDTKSGEFKITSYPNLQHEDAPEEHEEHEPAIPLPSRVKLVAEVARYSLTVENFLSLGIGSVLHFDGTHPVLGVDLILNGAKVGRGEIVSLGNVLGIRVLEA